MDENGTRKEVGEEKSALANPWIWALTAGATCGAGVVAALVESAAGDPGGWVVPMVVAAALMGALTVAGCTAIDLNEGRRLSGWHAHLALAAGGVMAVAGIAVMAMALGAGVAVGGWLAAIAG